jgi:hypothetical protein
MAGFSQASEHFWSEQKAPSAEQKKAKTTEKNLKRSIAFGVWGGGGEDESDAHMRTKTPARLMRLGVLTR